MRISTCSTMRNLDLRLMDDLGVDGEELMTLAASGVAEATLHLIEATGLHEPTVQCLAGRGNNGGDAFAVARLLTEAEVEVEVLIAGTASDIRGDALIHLGHMKAAGINPVELPTPEDWENYSRTTEPRDILVDGLLGTGASGPPRGPAGAAIHFINQAASRALIVSIDLPSGLNGDTGQCDGEAVLADLTVTIGLPKQGLVRPEALEYVGRLEVVDIGIPDKFLDEAQLPDDLLFFDRTDVQQLLQRRPRRAHKGHFGHVLLIGGAQGYSGAITMAGKAALRSGAGCVSLLVPKSVVSTVAMHMPELMVHGGEETEEGSLSPECWHDWRGKIDNYDAVLIGPGMTLHQQTLLLVRKIIQDVDAPLVVDADAISVFENRPHWLERSNGPTILTPHPGELATLMGSDTETVQNDRFKAIADAVEQTGSIVTLKGAGTLISAPNKPVYVNLTGNPGMATAGSGDVLSGLITGLVGQGFEPIDAACCAVYLHGAAGDMAAMRSTQTAMVAQDIIEELPNAFRSITIR